MLRKLFVIALLLFGPMLWSQYTIKTMVYNLLEFPSASPGGRSQILRNILNEYEPDIFMVCELENEAGADEILNISLNDQGNYFSRAPFVTNQSGNNSIQQLLFYRHDKFVLLSSEIIETSVRDINRYQLKLNTTNGQNNPIVLDIYLTHLKSSPGSSNEATRLDMVTEFTDAIETIDPDSFVIFAGDLNVYTSDEPAYQELLDPTNNITMVDPIDTPGDWSENVNFQAVHTQSTRVDSGPFGAGSGSGMDDRFDFILISENMLTDPDMRYVPNTYKAFGNNGNCYNDDISDTSCTGEFSQQLRNRLFSMSDHIPVIMNLETDEDVILGTSEFSSEISPVSIENTITAQFLRLIVKPDYINRVKLEVFNVLGQRVMQVNSVNSEATQLDVSHLANGVYYVRTNLPGNRTLKFLKAF